MNNEASKSSDKVEKKGWIKRHPILTVIGILFIGFIFAGMGDKNTTPKSVVTDTTAQETASTNEKKEKQYQEVFTFNGNGIKKSEPFSITGDRFKIAYNCSGEAEATLCQAFVYKVGSTLPQGVMNTVGNTKDETIIYGAGEYYIDANVIGKFSMTVFDYK